MEDRQRENEDHFASYYRKTAVELNNIGISFLHSGIHQVALETLSNATRIMKYYFWGRGNEAAYQNDAEKSIGRAMEALRRETYGWKEIAVTYIYPTASEGCTIWT